MGAILDFFTGPLGKIAMYAIGALFAAGVIWAAWAHYDSIVSSNAKYKAENAQLKQTVKDQADQVRHAEELLELSSKSIDTLEDRVDDINEQYSTLEQYLSSVDAQKADRPASEVLKETIRKLKEMKK
jgi:hypothetical protein